MANQILVLRHAEKPDDADDPHLSREGAVRAGKLAGYLDGFGPLAALIAAKASAQSNRCVETLTPLAAATGLDISHGIKDHDVAGLISALDLSVASDARTVVCWHHEHIPKVLRGMGAPPGTYPDPWPDTVFDLVIFVRIDAGGGVTAEQMTQPF